MTAQRFVARDREQSFLMPPEAGGEHDRALADDPDSRVVKGSRGRGFMQGYNAQAVANEHQIVIAAEVMHRPLPRQPRLNPEAWRRRRTIALREDQQRGAVAQPACASG